MKYVFIDAEFTGEHSQTTLVSLGLVDISGRELYLTLNDFDSDQVTDWLEKNVLLDIEAETRVSSRKAYEIMSEWLEVLSDGSDVAVVSCGLGADWILMAELYKWSVPNAKYFHSLYHLPEFLNHGKHLDLRTLFSITGYDPNIDRIEFAGKTKLDGKRHNALFDAHIVRECFLRLLEHPEMHFLNDK